MLRPKERKSRELIAQFSRSCGREEKASNEPLSSGTDGGTDDLQSFRFSWSLELLTERNIIRTKNLLVLSVRKGSCKYL